MIYYPNNIVRFLDAISALNENDYHLSLIQLEIIITAYTNEGDAITEMFLESSRDHDSCRSNLICLCRDTQHRKALTYKVKGSNNKVYYYLTDEGKKIIEILKHTL